MKQTKIFIVLWTAAFFLQFSGQTGCLAQENVSMPQRIHDRNQPRPPVVDPGTPGSDRKAGVPPTDAIVLFDGTGLAAWRNMDGAPASWTVKDGCMFPVPGCGDIRTLQNFGDCQLHVEFATPNPPTGTGQGRGNSGVFLMDQYEVQILDSYNNDTYADGQAAAIYGQFPPQVNACRAPGEWQTYDIVFHAPRFAASRELLHPAFITVLHNGVLTQDHVALAGPTSWLQRQPYEPHPAKLPLTLQQHGNPVRFRNIWIRELPAGIPGRVAAREISPGSLVLDRYVGRYEAGKNRIIEITRKGDQLLAKIFGNDIEDFAANSETHFISATLDAILTFKATPVGRVDELELDLCGEKYTARKVTDR